jgi:hypothetical protein
MYKSMLCKSPPRNFHSVVALAAHSLVDVVVPLKTNRRTILDISNIWIKIQKREYLATWPAFTFFSIYPQENKKSVGVCGCGWVWVCVGWRRNQPRYCPDKSEYLSRVMYAWGLKN